MDQHEPCANPTTQVPPVKDPFGPCLALAQITLTFHIIILKSQCLWIFCDSVFNLSGFILSYINKVWFAKLPMMAYFWANFLSLTFWQVWLQNSSFWQLSFRFFEVHFQVYGTEGYQQILVHSTPHHNDPFLAYFWASNLKHNDKIEQNLPALLLQSLDIRHVGFYDLLPGEELKVLAKENAFFWTFQGLSCKFTLSKSWRRFLEILKIHICSDILHKLWNIRCFWER